VLSTWQAVRASQAEAVALAGLAETEAAEQKARAAAEAETQAKETALARQAEMQAVLDFVENRIFAAARPEGQEAGLGREVTLRRAIDAALPFIAKGFAEQPLIEARLRMTLARSYLLLGEVKIAAEQYQAAGTIYSQHRGPDHPDTLRSTQGVADCYYVLAQYPEAVKLYEETLALQKRRLGPDHADTLRSMDGLARTYFYLARHAEALKLYGEALALCKAKLGPDHPDTLQSMNGLARSYYGLGRYAEALKLWEETLALRKAKLGPDHPDTLRSMNNIAIIYYVLGRHAEALKLWEETLALQKAKLGPDRPDTLLKMNNVAMVLATASDVKLRDVPRALELARKAAELSPKRADFRDTYGIARYRSGDWQGASADLEKAIGMRTPEDPQNADAGFFLAMAYWQLGDKDKARQWFARSVQWMEKGRSGDAMLKCYRAEAAALLEVEKKD
jgi:tetratricopeptide (TPR) repeat protein